MIRKKDSGWMIQIISSRHTTHCPGLAWEQLGGGGSMHKMLKTLRQAKPTHPPHWHIAVSSKARWDATASCGTLWAHSSQIWEICASPKSSTPLDRPQSLFKKISQPSGISYTPSHLFIDSLVGGRSKNQTKQRHTNHARRSINPLTLVLAQSHKRWLWTFQRSVLSGGPLIPIASEKAQQYRPSSQMWDGIESAKEGKTEKRCVNGKHLLCETIS